MTEAAEVTSNVQAYSVSELAFALKRTIEGAFGFVRLRGELSKVTHHSNGHVYLDIKDDKACIAGVVWKTQTRALGVRPETGLEVIVTGRITTYPGRSQYQIIIETMEPAGVGALLAQLERLKARLAAEGLFEPSRKRPLPAMPAVVGVITSPTGAVIRDILHRIAERWPCRVIVWPSLMQGEAAAGQVAAAIAGFNALDGAGAVPRPEVLIVARGGGSIEDLWPFNDEALVRAAAASAIPLISAVGHETDTTLIDFAADRRAPTPTAAAEFATPVLADLAAAVAGLQNRLITCGGRAIEHRRMRLAGAARGLPRPADLIGLAAQRLDGAGARLSGALGRNVAAHGHALAGPGRALAPSLVLRPLEQKTRRLADLAARLPPIVRRRLEREAERLTGLERQRLSLNPEGPLARGYALVRAEGGRLVRSARQLEPLETVSLRFADGERAAVIDAGAAPRRRARAPAEGQGDLF